MQLLRKNVPTGWEQDHSYGDSSGIAPDSLLSPVFTPGTKCECKRTGSIIKIQRGKDERGEMNVKSQTPNAKR